MTDLDQRTLRARFLDALADIKQIYADTANAIGPSGRTNMRNAYEALYVLGAYIPDEMPGWLPYGDMDDKAIAKARKHAEDGMASPTVTLELISQLRRLREQLTALGGSYGVTEGDIRSMIAEGFPTAFRKAVDSMESAIIWKFLHDLPHEDWSAVLDAVVKPIIRVLREAEARTDAKAHEVLERAMEGGPEDDPEDTSYARSGELAAQLAGLGITATGVPRVGVDGWEPGVFLDAEQAGLVITALGAPDASDPAILYRAASILRDPARWAPHHPYEQTGRDTASAARKLGERSDRSEHQETGETS